MNPFPLLVIVLGWFCLGLETGLRPVFTYHVGAGAAWPSFIVPLAVFIAICANPAQVHWSCLLLGLALDLAAPFDAATVGVAVDTFHVWWDPELKAQIERAGRENRIASYQVCDFNMPIAADPLLSRGYMGDGVVDQFGLRDQ